MKKRYTWIITAIVVFILFVVAGALVYNQNQEPKTAAKVRLGWQTSWATQGQLVQILKNTSIPSKNNLDITYTGFNSGAPLNEAALAKQVDVVFTGDQPAITLISKSSDWVIVGRLMYNRVTMYVPPKSTINKVSDLRGKTVAMPFGAAAQRAALRAEQSAGLTPGKDVQNINLDIYSQSDLVKDPNATKWGNIDALAGFDPTPAILESKGLVKYINTDSVVSVILMSKSYIQQNPNAPVDFLTAFKQSYNYYRDNVSQSNKWFTEASKLNIPEKALTVSASVEPNLNKADKVRITFSDSDYSKLQYVADYLYKQKLIKSAVNVKSAINTSYVDKVK